MTSIGQKMARALSYADCTECWAVPGANTLIDMIHPDTGRTMIYAHDAAAVQAKNPGAVRMTYDAWAAAKAARQQTPVTWAPITAETYEEQLGCLPPIAYTGWAYLVGEPYDHCVTTGHPRYIGNRRRGNHYEQTSRPVTVREWKELAR
jgi:hypothetical protein